MEDLQQNPSQIFTEINSKLINLEEKQKILKNRLLLIGKNLIGIKENTNKKNIEIKKDIEIIKKNMEKLLSFLETASSEFQKFAKKEDLNILAKQAKMFQPLKIIKKSKLK
jgi:hypothetical protein